MGKPIAYVDAVWTERGMSIHLYADDGTRVQDVPIVMRYHHMFIDPEEARRIVATLVERGLAG